MKKFVVISVLLFVFTISGCGDTSTESNGLSGDSPPDMRIEIDGESYKTELGSYCWDDSRGKAECVDTGGPKELLEDEEPIQIKAGQQIKLNMDYTPKPNEVHLSKIDNDDEMEMEMEIIDNQFTAPNEKGTYFYSYSVWWMDEEENFSHGSAYYAFAVEVQ